MTTTEAIAIVRRYNAWRRGSVKDCDQAKIAEAMTVVCDQLETYECAAPPLQELKVTDEKTK